MRQLFKPKRGRGTMTLLCVAAFSVSMLMMAIGASVAGANGVPLVKGDVLAGTGDAQVKNFSPTGTLQDTLTDSSGAAYTTGMCFDSEHNLYVTDFSTTMSKYNDEANVLISPWPSPFPLGHPESCTVDSANNIYTGGPFTPSIEKFNTSGALLETFSVESSEGTGGTDWVDLAANQCTIYYTNKGAVIRRYNVCTKTQEAAFASGLPAPCFALRIRPKTEEVLVACGPEVVRLSSSGAVLQTYPIPGHSELFALNLDPDGTTFWTGDINTGQVYRLNIETGEIINEFNSSPSTQLAGLSVVGEIEVSRPEITLAPLTAENEVGTTHTVTATVTEGGVPASGVLVKFQVTGANPQKGETTSNEKGEAAFTYKGEKAGTDTIVALFEDKAGKTVESNSVTKIWKEREATGPALDGIAGGTHYDKVTAKLTTRESGDLIVAFVAGDSPYTKGQVSKVSGGGLTWTLVARENKALGGAEVWTARASGVLNEDPITARATRLSPGSPYGHGYDEAILVAAFKSSPGLGAVAKFSSKKGAPTGTLTTTQANSWVWAVGDDWLSSIPRTVPAGQTLWGQAFDAVGDTYWVQSAEGITKEAGTKVTINDPAPVKDPFDLILVEVL